LANIRLAFFNRRRSFMSESAALQDNPRELITEIDFSKKWPEMLEATGNDKVYDNITAEYFPVIGSGIKRFRNKLFRFDGRLPFAEGTTTESFHAMEQQGFKAATHVHGAGFSRTFPEMQGQWPFAYVCLGSRANISPGYYSVCFACSISGTERIVRLYPWSEKRPNFFNFWPSLLGIQEISGT
jgi:hypothetical protein